MRNENKDYVRQMTRFWLGPMAGLLVAACGGGDGAPFGQNENEQATETVSEQPAASIPEDIEGHLTGFSYDPESDRLVIQGVSLDDTPYEAVYRRRPGMDRKGYHAYTSQSGPLGRHYTAYVKEVGDTRASVVVSGGQFGHYFGGASYDRTGGFDAPDVGPDSGSVTYAGRYVGLLNSAGDDGDLRPVAAGTDPAVISSQAAEVTGRVIINADFADNAVNGRVYDRRAVDARVGLSDLDLAPTSINGQGRFEGSVKQGPDVSVGSYGGVFGGKSAATVAGALHVTNHITAATNPEEYGMFVLSQCGASNANAVCNQPGR